jgi:hypothetical protein
MNDTHFVAKCLYLGYFVSKTSSRSIPLIKQSINRSITLRCEVIRSKFARKASSRRLRQQDFVAKLRPADFVTKLRQEDFVERIQ